MSTEDYDQNAVEQIPKKKKKMGRPASPNPNCMSIMVRVNRATYTKVAEKAKLRDMSINCYMKEMLTITM